MRFKTRLTLAFGFFAFLLCTLFAVLLAESLTALEDEIVSSLLIQEADHLQNRFQQSPEQLVMPDLDQLKGFLSDEPNLPEWLKSLETGFHQSEDYHVLVQDLDSDRRFYLVYDEASGLLDRYEANLWWLLVFLVLIVSAVVLGLGFYQSNLLTRPINQLAAQVETVNTEKPEIVPLPVNDEIGLLSRAYADLVDRLGQFIQREKAFTRYASHELMTPLSIIGNNLELLQNENVGADMRNRAIERLHRSTRQMQRQIEIFLMLAREEQLEPSSRPLDWDQLWQDIKAQFPRVSLSIQMNAEPRIHVSESVVQSILFNILGNVEKHGSPEQDAIHASVTLEADSLEITNALPRSEQSAASNYGFGLEINQKLCAAVGWSFTAREEDGTFFVNIKFDSDCPSEPDTGANQE